VKVCVDDIYVLEKTGQGGYQWHTGFKLPRPLAYGASVSTDRGVVCIGGSDGEQSHRDVLLLKWKPATRKVEIEQLPPLPEPCAFTSAVRIGDTVFVAGGLSTMVDATPMNNFWSLDLTGGDRWETLPSWEGPPRASPILASQHDGTSDKVYLFSGGDTAPGGGVQLLKDGYRYDPAAQTWARLSDAPRCLMAGMGSSLGAHHILLVGGNDVSYSGQDLADGHPGFPRDMLYSYHTLTDSWVQKEMLPENPVSGVLVKWDAAFVVAGGEVGPAVTSPRILRATSREHQQPFAILDWTGLAELPAPVGMASHAGVAGPFAGISGDALIIAGGANFPSPVWQSTKVWHDDIYVLVKDPTGDESYRWITGQKLDRPIAYGASVSTSHGVVCIGGNDSERTYSDVFLLWNLRPRSRNSPAELLVTGPFKNRRC
jgi:N-acetylneuraminic acid mutarotase